MTAVVAAAALVALTSARADSNPDMSQTCMHQARMAQHLRASPSSEEFLSVREILPEMSSGCHGMALDEV